MTKSDKKHWIVVLIYGGLLCLSLVAFLREPNPNPGGFDLNGLFQILGPTIGTFVLMGFTVVQMVGKRISLACGIGAIALLVVVSFLCLAMTLPIMMHI
jgi:hypothetical protein